MARIITIFILLGFWGNVSGIENKFNYLTSDNGLSQGSIGAIFQDKTGFIWIGTSGGLNRYDGYRVINYYYDENDSTTLPSNNITALNEDSAGNIWVGTIDKGIAVYLPDKDKFFRIKELIYKDQKINLAEISDIKQDKKGQIWVMDRIEGIFSFDSQFKLVKHFKNDPDDIKEIPPGDLHTMLFDMEDKLWLAVGNEYLCSLDKDRTIFTRYKIPEDEFNDDYISCMDIINNNTILLATLFRGVIKFNTITKEFSKLNESESNQLSSQRIMYVTHDKENIYLGSDGGGLNIINRNTNKISHIRYDAGNVQTLNSDAVDPVFVDRSETLWLGSYSGGVNYYSKYKYKFKSHSPNPLKKNSLSYSNVTAMMEDEGKIWIGTDGGGINVYDPETDSYEHYKADKDKPGWLRTNIIIHFYKDKEDNIYISSFNGGLHVYNKKTGLFKQYVPDKNDPYSISGMHPWFTLEDSYGTFWVGTLIDGLNVFDKNTGKFIRHYQQDLQDPTALNNPNICYILEDSKRELWLGTLGGGIQLYNRKEDTFKKYTFSEDDSNSLSNDAVFCIFEDSRNNLWIGTTNGLNLYNRSKDNFKRYFKEDGLPDNTIYGILEDDNGYLWISTGMGICKFDPVKNTYRNFNISDGLQGNEFNYTACVSAKNGKMYFGGKKGFNEFNPLEISDNPHVPGIALVDFRIFNQSVKTLPVKRKGVKEEIAVSQLNEIKLSYKQNVISFEFAALDFGNPQKNSYKYMLEGFNQDWISTTSNNRIATYTNLKGGTYTFKVIGSNGDGKWNEEGLSIDLTVIPPFWKTKWFITLLVLFILGLIFAFIKLRERQLKQDKMILENKINESMKEIEDQQKLINVKNRELEEKIEKEKHHKWLNTGIVTIGNILNNNKESIDKLSKAFLTELLKYTNHNQGAVFIKNDKNEDDVYLDMTASYALDKINIEKKRFELNEGLVGACFKDKELKILSDMPEGYSRLASGIGSTQMHFLTLFPIWFNEDVLGVLEIFSKEKLTEDVMELIEKTTNSFASIISILDTGEKTQKLLEKQYEQAQELISQEEELKQNIEEMKATQEDSYRKEEELKKLSDEFKKKEKKYISEIEKLKSKK